MIKKIAKLAVLLIAIIISACSNFDEPLTTTIASSEISEPITVQVVDGQIQTLSIVDMDNENNAICFKNQESFNAFKDKLSNMNVEKRLKKLKSLHIQTLYDVYKIADEELERIGADAISEQDFRQKYSKHIEKYKGSLIRNTSDETDLTLYVPDSENIDSYICNNKQIVVIGDKITKINLKPIIPQYSNFQVGQLSSRSSENSIYPTNKITFEPNGDSKKHIHFEIARKEVLVRVTMYCRKKMWYGWKDDNDRIMVFRPEFNNNPNIKLEWITYEPYYCQESHTKMDFLMLRAYGNSNLTGMAYLWTDYSVERDENGNIIPQIINGLKVPVCDFSKAERVNINLPY